MENLNELKQALSTGKNVVYKEHYQVRQVYYDTYNEKDNTINSRVTNSGIPTLISLNELSIEKQK